MAVLFVLGGVALVIGLVALFLRFFPGRDADLGAESAGPGETPDIDLDGFRGFDGGGSSGAHGGGGHGGGSF